MRLTGPRNKEAWVSDWGWVSLDDRLNRKSDIQKNSTPTSCCGK
jgi:hypothetical protein